MEKRFERIFKEGKGLGRSFEIWRDIVTGVCYLISLQDGDNPCITPLLGSDGKPLIMNDRSEENAKATGDLDWTRF